MQIKKSRKIPWHILYVTSCCILLQELSNAPISFGFYKLSLFLKISVPATSYL